MARMVDEESRAVSLHEDAADSEELFEEALRYQTEPSQLSHLSQLLSATMKLMTMTLQSTRRSVMATGMLKRTVTVLVALLFAAPNARAVRRLERASIVGNRIKPNVTASALEACKCEGYPGWRRFLGGTEWKRAPRLCVAEIGLASHWPGRVTAKQIYKVSDADRDLWAYSSARSDVYA